MAIRILTNMMKRKRALSLVMLMMTLVFVVTASVWAVRAADEDAEKVEKSADVAGDWFTVEKRSFDLKIISTGELEAREKVEIKNKVEGRTTIVELIDEGAMVKAGDQLCRLADDEIREQLERLLLEVEQGKSDLVAAEQNLAIKQSEAVSEEESAKVKLDLANLDLKKWEEGTVPQERRDLEVALEKAQRELVRAERNLEESMQLYEEKFISESEMEDDEIALIDAKSDLETAQLKIEIYEKYTRVRDERKFNSDVEQAVAELDRTKSKNISQLEQAQSNLSTKKRSLKIREDRVAKAQEQLDNTIVLAPQDGMVVYGTSVGSSWRRHDPIVQGREVHFNETLFVLPDTSQMVAALKVHEALYPQVKVGQPVAVSIDALQGETIQGKVWQIGVMAEDSSWVNPDLREYQVKVELPEGANNTLKPAMRCSGEIITGRVEDALAVPVQTVVTEGKSQFVYVPAGNGRVRERDVKIGRASESYVEILEGLEEGDRILVRGPRPGEVVKD